jgi:hypothetical protein
MLNEVQKVKKVKTPATENQKVIENHKNAAAHHEAAAMHHHEAAKHHAAGNKDMACGCSLKAKGQSKIAEKLQNKNLKKYATTEK